VEVTSAEDGAGRLAFLRGLLARGRSGVQLVISDAHRGLMRGDRLVHQSAGLTNPVGISSL
jgi:transposase-like protein